MKFKQSNIFLLSSIVIVGLLVNLGFKKFDDPNKEKLLLEISSRGFSPLPTIILAINNSTHHTSK